MSEYISNADFRRQKTALTRAINSQVNVKVLETCEKTLDEWAGKCWPDDWSRWARALDDAFYSFSRSERYDDDQDLNDGKITRRFRAAFDRFHR